MNQPQPIETAHNSDLRGSWLALQRSAARARQIAMQTGTALVVIRNGVLEHIYPIPFSYQTLTGSSNCDRETVRCITQSTEQDIPCTDFISVS